MMTFQAVFPDLRVFQKDIERAVHGNNQPLRSIKDTKLPNSAFKEFRNCVKKPKRQVKLAETGISFESRKWMKMY